MRKTALVVLVGLSLAVASCSSGGGEEVASEASSTTAAASPEASSAEPEPSPSSAEPTPSETATPTPTEVESPALPTRAEMTEAERILAEAVFIQSLATDTGLGDHTDEERIAAGDAACDSMDAGAEFRDMLIATATLLPRAASVDSVAALAGVAAGTLCPEHAGAF